MNTKAKKVKTFAEMQYQHGRMTNALSRPMEHICCVRYYFYDVDAAITRAEQIFATHRASYTKGSWPASTRYFAQAKPDNPPPIMATFFFDVSVDLSVVLKLVDKSLAIR